MPANYTVRIQIADHGRALGAARLSGTVAPVIRARIKEAGAYADVSGTTRYSRGVLRLNARSAHDLRPAVDAVLRSLAEQGLTILRSEVGASAAKALGANPLRALRGQAATDLRDEYAAKHYAQPDTDR